MGYKGRDVEVLTLDGGQCVVMACDSCGAIGAQELDVVKVSPRLTGRLTARVALMEVMAVGGEPKMVAVTVANEPEPTGEEIVAGITEELEKLGLSMGADGVAMGVSTEKNMPTRQTGLGVTVIGTCGKNDLRVERTEVGDGLYCLGTPYVGEEVVAALEAGEGVMAEPSYVRKLARCSQVHDILPVGSGGIKKEGERLVAGIGGQVIWADQPQVDLYQSAGPATVMLFTMINGPENIVPPDLSGISLIRVGEIRAENSDPETGTT